MARISAAGGAARGVFIQVFAHRFFDNALQESRRKTYVIVYLAGPMTGYPEYNRKGFALAERFAIRRGWQVRSPQNTDPAHAGPCPAGQPQTTSTGSHPYPCWVRASLRMMLDCDSVLTLPGWRQSKGAQLERLVAEGCGMPIIELSPTQLDVDPGLE